MAAYISLLFCLSISYFSQSQQNYLKYYPLIDSAQTLEQRKDYLSALTLYNQAFSQVDYPLKKDLKQVIKLAKKANDKTVIKNCKANILAQNKLINKTYKVFIDSLFKIDQQVRQNKFIKARQYLLKYNDVNHHNVNYKTLNQSTLLMNKWKITDSLNSIALITKINQYGFPSQLKVGKKSFYSAFEILVHFGLSQPDKILQPILDKALINGELSPSIYAYISDCQKVRFKKEQIYYQFQPHYYKKLSKIKQGLILKNRIDIGLYSSQVLQ